MATNDLITAAEAKSALNITGSTQDTELGGYITAVSQLLDEKCGPVIIRTVTNETHPTDHPRYVDLHEWPVSTVTTVTEYESDGTSRTLTAETASTKQADGYMLDPEVRANQRRRIFRRSEGAPYSFPTGGFVVATYEAGRYAATASVALNFKEACKIIVAHLWRIEQGTGNVPFGGVEEAQLTPSGFAIPNRAVQLLVGELRRLTAA
jgi:hypothetical protein